MSLLYELHGDKESVFTVLYRLYILCNFLKINFFTFFTKYFCIVAFLQYLFHAHPPAVVTNHFRHRRSSAFLQMASAVKSLVAEVRWRGLWGTVRAMKMNKLGTMQNFIGEDEFNNRYFEKKTESYGRHRWVEYVDERNPDSLKVTPEWHAWLHHNIDIAPVKVPLPKPMYQTDAVGNSTGTRNAYFQPNHRLAKEFAGTAEEKYEMWKPREKKEVVEKGGDVLDLK